jgi:hypothetical protein
MSVGIISQNEAELEKPASVRLQPEQLICMMAATMLSGCYTFKDPAKAAVSAARIANRIYGLIVHETAFTEWEEDTLEELSE